MILIGSNSDIFVDNGDGTFTHATVDGQTLIFDANTTTMVDNGDGTYVFTNANGDTITVDVIGDVVTNIQNYVPTHSSTVLLIGSNSDIFVDNGDGTFTHTTVDGQTVTFDANTTTLVDNGDGTYVFTNANGDTITVDVIGDVVTNIQNQGDIYTEIMNLIGSNSDIFVDNGDGTFTHTTVDGTVLTFDANTTTLVDNGDGTYVFTNANGDTITVDVIGDVVTNIQNQGDIYNEIMNLIGSNSDIFVDNGDGTFTHTTVDGQTLIFDARTSSLINNGDGTFTFDNGNGIPVIIDIPASVVNHWNEILNGGPVVVSGDTYNSLEEYLLYFVQTNETLTTIIDNGDGTFTYTDENNQDFIINMASGPKGDDGASAYDIWIDAGNTGTEQDFLDSLVGPQGDQGIAGTDGQDGNDGTDGKSAYQEWIDAGNTGTEQEFLDSLVGPQGDQGTAGTDGQDGNDGTDGKSAYQEWIDAGNTGSEQDFLDSLVG